jgi:hypothetical protein
MFKVKKSNHGDLPVSELTLQGRRVIYTQFDKLLAASCHFDKQIMRLNCQSISSTKRNLFEAYYVHLLLWLIPHSQSPVPNDVGGMPLLNDNLRLLVKLLEYPDTYSLVN